MIQVMKPEGEADTPRIYRAVCCALIITSVNSLINVMPLVRQISRAQAGLLSRAGAPAGSC